MSPRPGRRPWVALSAALCLGGCYTYRLPHGPTPAPGAYVAIRLFRDATDSLALQLGPGVVYVEGVVVTDDSSGLQLAVTKVEGKTTGAHWAGERFTFPHSLYSSVEERRLSVPGTVMLAGIAVGAVVVVYNTFGTNGTGNSQTGGVVGPAQ